MFSPRLSASYSYFSPRLSTIFAKCSTFFRPLKNHIFLRIYASTFNFNMFYDVLGAEIYIFLCFTTIYRDKNVKIRKIYFSPRPSTIFSRFSPRLSTIYSHFSPRPSTIFSILAPPCKHVFILGPPAKNYSHFFQKEVNTYKMPLSQMHPSFFHKNQKVAKCSQMPPHPTLKKLRPKAEKITKKTVKNDIFFSISKKIRLRKAIFSSL